MPGRAERNGIVAGGPATAARQVTSSLGSRVSAERRMASGAAVRLHIAT
jgi:hypothetical protein